MKALALLELIKMMGVSGDIEKTIDESIAELEALENRSCDKCKFGKFGIDSFGVEIECSLNWDCIRGRTIDRWESRC